MTEDSSVLELKADMEYCLREGLKDLAVAHQRRLDDEEKARLATIEARRLLREKVQRERAERLKALLSRHTDRWMVSLNGVRIIAGKKTISFPCPSCKAELPHILENLGDAMEATFERMWKTEDFSNGSGHARIVVSDLTCKCGQRVVYRCIPLPF